MMSFRAQMYERARKWLEDNQITRKEFRSMFNAQLDQEKGDQWQREGLFLEPSMQEQRATREAFAREVAQAKFAQPKRQGRKRKALVVDKRNRRHYRDLKTGRFTKYPRRVKKSSPSRVKKPRRVS